MDKSYVTMEQKQCIVCGKTFDTGSILLDRTLKNRFDMHTVTGIGMCEEHENLRKLGYVAMIGIDPTKSRITGNNVDDLSQAYRTGEIAHIRESAFKAIFNSEVPPKMVAFCEQEVITKLEAMQKEGK